MIFFLCICTSLIIYFPFPSAPLHLSLPFLSSLSPSLPSPFPVSPTSSPLSLPLSRTPPFPLQVPENEVDRMHIRDNLKAVTVSEPHTLHLRTYEYTCMDNVHILVYPQYYLMNPFP